MARPSQEPLGSFAQLQEAFRPYIYRAKHAKEARKSLVKYLQTFITLSDGDTRSHASLPSAENVVAVRHITREVTGGYRRFLEALEANVSARSTFNEITTSLAELNSPDPIAGPDAGDILPTYVELLHLRERLQKLQILQHYLNELISLGAFRDGLQNSNHVPQYDPITNGQSQARPPNGEVVRSIEGADSLTEELESTVLRARSQMERQQRLLEELKARRDSFGAIKSSAKRLEGLATSRDELHSWVQEKLASSDVVENESKENDLDDERIQSGAIPTEADVRSRYDSYCKTRKRLVEIASTVDESSVSTDTVEAKAHSTSYHSPEVDSSVSTLPFIINRIFRADELGGQLGNQTKFLSDMLERERILTDGTLGKLRDESHLIPSYPILANQERFQCISNAFGRGNLSNDRLGSASGDLHEQLKAWSFASSASSTALEEFLHSHLSQAKTALDNAEGSLDDLRDQVGQKPEAKDNGGSAREDVWAAEIEEGASTLDALDALDGRGPWANLNGRIGIS